jgi:hypothetical protein
MPIYNHVSVPSKNRWQVSACALQLSHHPQPCVVFFYKYMTLGTWLCCLLSSVWIMVLRRSWAEQFPFTGFSLIPVMDRYLIEHMCVSSCRASTFCPLVMFSYLQQVDWPSILPQCCASEALPHTCMSLINMASPGNQCMSDGNLFLIWICMSLITSEDKSILCAYQ